MEGIGSTALFHVNFPIIGKKGFVVVAWKKKGNILANFLSIERLNGLLLKVLV